MPNTTKTNTKKSGFARISIEHDLVLSHHLSQRLYKRFFELLDHSLFVSTKVLRAQKRDKEAARIETAARELCDKVETDIKAASDRIIKTLADAHITSPLGQSDGTLTIKASFSTGISLRILDLLSRVDRLFMQIESLELFNLCSADECSRLMRFWAGEFRHFLTALLAVRHKLSSTDQPKEANHENAGN